MSKLSPAARAVLTAVTLTKYDVPPEGLPAFAEEIAPLLAVALRAAAEIVAPLSYEDVWTDGQMLQYEKDDPVRNKLLAIADELETQ